MLLSSNVTWPKSYHQFPTLISTCRGPEEGLSIGFMEFPRLFKCSECSALMVLSSTWAFLALAAYSSHPGKRWFAWQIQVNTDKMQLCQMKFHVAIISLEGISKSVTPKLSKLEPRNVWCLPSVRDNVQKRLPKNEKLLSFLTNAIQMTYPCIFGPGYGWGMLRCFSLNSHPVVHAQVSKNMQKRSQLLIHTNSLVPSYQKEEPFTNFCLLFFLRLAKCLQV